MKRLVFIILGLTVCGLLFAQASPFSFYGSARSGFFYVNETYPEGADPESRLYLFDQTLIQPNSRFGFNYQKDNVTGKFEIGANSSVRLLWGKYDFDGFSLLAGKDEVFGGVRMDSNQKVNSDMGLVGYGAVDGGKIPQIRFGFMEDAVYLALLQTDTSSDPAGAGAAIDALIPKINLGWKGDLNEDMKLHVSFMLQMYSYNTDFGGPDASVMSWLGGLTYDAAFSEQMRLRVGGYFGSNIGDMGFASEPGAGFNAVDEETVDVTSMGGYLTFNFDVTDQFGLGVGVGYASTAITDDVDINGDDYADDRMAFYLQLPYKTLGSFTITPEVGMMMEMKNRADEDDGSSMYFGAQLRYDF